ncbi:Tubulin gamma-2 chain [Zea mays]|uniref:Tubulin gamma-2 chain n=1 Tax=Zea mays TaxID=4577 RepID=A0A1D6F116_MAIZE|nr:Tubulin gamma-2 chain [Zea mays]
MNVSIDISGLPITLSECGIVGIWVQEELVLQFTNLKAIKLLFFVFRHVRIIFLLLFSLYVDVAAFYAVFLPFLAIILSFGFQWSPDRASVFGSSAEDGFLNVWDHEKVGKKKNSNVPAGLFFQHAGHRVVPLRGLCFCVLGRRFIDMAESLCQKRALEAFRLDPTKWGVNLLLH